MEKISWLQWIAWIMSFTALGLLSWGIFGIFLNNLTAIIITFIFLLIFALLIYKGKLTALQFISIGLGFIALCFLIFGIIRKLNG